MKLCLFSLALCLLTSCAGKIPQLPEFHPQSELVLNREQKLLCQQPYHSGGWQFVHAISFTMQKGGGTNLIGVTVLEGDQIETALTTIEGLTLFTARFAGELEVDRAVPPFDNPEFGVGLMNDVRALFVGPTAAEFQYGYSGDSQFCCRMISHSGEVTEVRQPKGYCWQSNTYSVAGAMTRDIKARSCRSEQDMNIPGEIELNVPGPNGYTLHMTLIRAEKIVHGSIDRGIRQ